MSWPLRAIFFIHSVYKQNGLKKYSQKVLANRSKTCTFAANFIGWPIVPVGAGQANCSLVGWERPFGMSRMANTLEANS